MLDKDVAIPDTQPSELTRKISLSLNKHIHWRNF